MRVIFMGTPDFAVPTLDALHESTHEIVAVYARPDAKSGRGSALHPCAVKARALELGLPVFTPRTLRDEQVQAELAELAPDMIVVAAYGAILPREVLEIPTYQCINVHGSLLPRWRGAAPIQRSILAGDEKAGVCVMQMEEGLDTGDYHLAGVVDIAQKSAEQLSAELAQLGARAIADALDPIATGTYEWTAQTEETVTYAEKIAKAETLLDPAVPALSLMRRVQASSKSAPARCKICGKEVAVTAAQPAADALGPGEVLLQKKRLVLGTVQGSLEILSIKPQGKAEMPIQNWLAGLRADETVWQAI